MPFAYSPCVPPVFADKMRKISKARLVEVLWDVMCQSPWFDETSANDNPQAVAERVHEIIMEWR